MVQGFNPLDYFGTMMWQHTQRTTGSAAGSSAMSAVMGASRYSFFVPTQDGRWVIFTQMLPHQAHALSRAVGIEHTFDDPRFDKQPQFATAEDAQAWEDLLWEAMSEQPYEHWEKVFLADDDIVFELARFSEEGLDHQQIRHNGETITVQDTVRGAIEQVGPVAAFAATPSRIDRSAPALDEHGDDFSELAPRSPSTAPAPAHALDGVTIVELGYFYAMPYGVTMAGALGARVIKLEGAAGDPMRSAFGAPDVGGAKTMEGKESLAVDLQTAEGRKIVQEVRRGPTCSSTASAPGSPNAWGSTTPRCRSSTPARVRARGGLRRRRSARPPPDLRLGRTGGRGEHRRYGGRWLDPDSPRA